MYRENITYGKTKERMTALTILHYIWDEVVWRNLKAVCVNEQTCKNIK